MEIKTINQYKVLNKRFKYNVSKPKSITSANQNKSQTIGKNEEKMPMEEEKNGIQLNFKVAEEITLRVFVREILEFTDIQEIRRRPD